MSSPGSCVKPKPASGWALRWFDIRLTGMSAGCPGIGFAPVRHRRQRPVQADTPVGQRVFDPRRHLAEGMARDELVMRQFSQLLYQLLLADAFNPAFQFAEPDRKSVV